jgi:hypothetical protein
MAQSDNTHNFSIFSMAKNSQLTEQAIVIEKDDTFTITLKPLNKYISHMDEYFKNLYTLMMNYEKDYPYNHEKNYKTKKYFFENNEFVQGIIFHRVLMRKGSYFYVMQQSDRGVRFLLYAMNRIHHSSVALGFTMILPDAKKELGQMKQELYKFTVKQIEEFNLQNFTQLINNESLYFL